MYCRHYSVGLAAIIAGVTASTCVQASTVRAGSAVTVVRDVSGSVSGTSWEKKVEGDDVYENEFVRTAARSSAVISFVDETKISIGQAATMKIDRVVLKSNRSVEELIVSAEAGAMRWNSGTSPSSAYQVKTPEAIIRPLGTIFDLLVESQRTMVVLRSGTIEVCSVGAPQRCRTSSQPGEMIIATPSDLEGPRRGGLGPSEFVDRCLSADAMPCLITASVSPAQPAPPKPGGVPVHAAPPVTPEPPIVPLPPISTCGPDQGVWPNCCPPGHYWDGRRCVEVGGPCLPGQRRVGRQCVEVGSPCLPGQRRVGRQCVEVGGPCLPGQRRVGRQCVEVGGPCLPGQRRVGRQCVGIPEVRERVCPQGQHHVGSRCVPSRPDIMRRPSRPDFMRPRPSQPDSRRRAPL